MRIVSLVPSLTESLWALNAGPWVVGVTKFCVRPPEARSVAKVIGGTKDPDVQAILALKPDLVVADADENKPEHLEALARGKIPVHVTHIDAVDDAARELVGIGQRMRRGIEAEGWAQRIRERASALRQTAAIAPPLRVFVPIWKQPLMTAGGSTYLSDLLGTIGLENVFGDAESRYFETTWEEVARRGPQAVLLPTEPYRFRESDREPGATRLGLPIGSVRIIDGQALTWFGTRTLEALETAAQWGSELRAALA